MRSRILLFFTGLLLVPLVTYFVILFARGYRPDFRNKEFKPTGILATSSLPENAQVYVNGILKTATNSNFNLEPGDYTVEIKKDGFQPWKKTLKVATEEVTRAYATLFPSVSSLKSITSTGASIPVISSDGTKAIYFYKNILYLLDLSESPLGLLNRDPKQIYTLNTAPYTLIWSPDSRQILTISTSSAQLIDLGQQPVKTISSPSGQLALWSQQRAAQELQKDIILPATFREILATSAANLVWSPKENKLLYTATASAVIPDNLIKPLPGSNSTPQARALKPGSIYVYDVEEDKNFEIKIENSKLKIENLRWFSDSWHLVFSQPGKITVMEYDNSNPTVIYQGPMEQDFAYPYPSGKQILILTNLNPSVKNSVPNLYAISLR
ncbi:MAG: PEGA domain protein [Candidatus Amesbacteria bacterium GW2011_GWA2_42_12]|uniref:PEGA domain protein n=1 Tax=Candidatus Amesbacteria bacterium GW2011_GWA2_42_12 TaxID=1618356 RepID=A0A0G0Y6N1_9BACT|nr:MAG: PEGA domain protein [Candidatus Amesbacteria bacterium GW2011_GWA2_42_12]